MKKVIISSKNISQKQWADLLLELNLMRKAWQPYAKLELSATGIGKIITVGTKKYDNKYLAKEND
jgi:hypothetical protein|tara:strand:+ start:433 stop:627 length:195 start_codon:yes stop_codon:yes gene_type:complete